MLCFFPKITHFITKILTFSLFFLSTKSKKYFVRTAPKVSSPRTRTPPPTGISTSPKPFRSNWKLKTRQEYIDTLSEKERGDKAKLDQQPNRYFKRKLLSDIVALHGHYYQNEDKETLHHFIHFLKGMFSVYHEGPLSF